MSNYRIMGVLTFVILTHTILSSIYFRRLSSGVLKKVTDSKSIFLTFDDGPNPTYTLEVLDLLEKYEIKATFFVIAKKAKKYNDIIDRIIEDEHALGLHSNSHKNAWLRTSWQTKKDFKESMKVFGELDYPVRFYRAPWGLFNPFTHYYSNKFGLKTVLWSIITDDWNPNTSVDKIVDKVLDNIQEGDIIVLHDSNHNMDTDNGAPKNTIQALDIILPNLIDRGFKFETIDEGMEDQMTKEIFLNRY